MKREPKRFSPMHSKMYEFAFNGDGRKLAPLTRHATNEYHILHNMHTGLYEKFLLNETILHGLNYVIRDYGFESTMSIMFFDILTERFMGCLTIVNKTVPSITPIKQAYREIMKQRVRNKRDLMTHEGISLDAFEMLMDDGDVFPNVREKMHKKFRMSVPPQIIEESLINAADRFVLYMCEDYQKRPDTFKTVSSSCDPIDIIIEEHIRGIMSYYLYVDEVIA